MDKTIANSLQLLGFSPKEIKFFKTCFEIGPCTINEVAKKARLERSTAYLIAQDLIAKGLIQEDLKSYRKTIFAIEPKTLLRLVAAKQRQLRRQELELEENLPQLQSIYQASEIRPKVKVFEGRSGLLSVFEDILSAKGEILLWTNQETESQFFTSQDHDKFIALRVKRGIQTKVLAVRNKKGEELIKADEHLLRQTEVLPEGIDFSAETYIYGNKVAIVDFKKDIIGVIIESEPIANSQRAIFEMNWNFII